ncbi:hypothetical protein OJ253_704 [Cryptosporidium canis]|uniref:Peptidase S9 prolyl oligopeptidase catalytic domain-containing protein n=1 Tax=Cryptosporidium canis TaxID=195482 RepID=A0A9D5DQ30_9CRYT|nr:hypothetical protein OJ253_704 [Cryptosporidium canis]
MDILDQVKGGASRYSAQCVISRIVLFILSVLLLLGLLVWVFQEKLLFFPNINGKRDLASNLPGFKHPNEKKISSEDVTLITDDNVKIHCWFMTHRKFDRYINGDSDVVEVSSGLIDEGSIQSEDCKGSKYSKGVRKAPKYMRHYFPEFADKYEQQEKVPTIIFFHGNSGNIGHRLPRFWEFYNFVGVNILAVSYRGYGDSEGVPSEEGFYLDAKAALDYVLSRTDVVDRDKIFAFGHSIGGAVAIDLASKFKLTGLIVENTFKDIQSIALRVYPVFKYLGFLLQAIQRLQFDSISKIASVKSPILFVVGSEDEIIPPTHSIELYKRVEAQDSLNKIYTVPGGTHNDTWIKGGVEFHLTLMQFIYNAIDFAKPGAPSSSDYKGLEEVLTSSGTPLENEESVKTINFRKSNKLN